MTSPVINHAVMKKKTLIATVFAGLLVLAACSMADTTPSTTSTSSSTTTSTTTTTVPQVLSTPEPPPRPGAKYKIVKLGSIEIPSLKVKQPIVRGVALRSFDFGVGWWPGTAIPGGYGNMVLGGHRTSGRKPFRHVDQLKPGDPIVITTATATYTYIVRTTAIIDDSDLWVVDQKPGYMLTLFACHPVGSTSKRIVVFADLQRA